jgi:hypothetical protein
MTLRDRELKLRSFLGYNENVRLELIIPLKKFLNWKLRLEG